MKVIETSFLEERQHRIIELFKKKGRFTVKELSRVFSISGATIRSDLKELAAQGKLIRTHGGAMYNQESDAGFPFYSGKNRRKRVKEQIGREAAKLISEGEVIFIDASTTASAMLPFLAEKEEITVITNSLETAYKLAQLPNLQVISLGGRLRRESLSFVDARIDPLIPESIGKAFMGAQGFSLDQGLTDVNPSEITVKRSIAQRSRAIIGLVDSSKWDKVSYGTFVPTGRIHTIISDQNAPENMVAETEKRGIKVIQVPNTQG